MPAIRVLYCRTRHWSTPILRAAMWSPWSHEAVIMDDEGGYVIDATFAHGGVRRRALQPLLDDCTKHEIREIDCPNPAGAYDFLRGQIGAPYDTAGVLGIGLHRDWQDESAWFCSELAEAALAAGGNQRFINQPRRVTPPWSWRVR